MGAFSVEKTTIERKCKAIRVSQPCSNGLISSRAACGLIVRSVDEGIYLGGICLESWKRIRPLRPTRLATIARREARQCQGVRRRRRRGALVIVARH